VNTMAKKTEAKAVAEMQPDEINALKVVVQDFMTRVTNIDNEIELLKDDRKELIEEFSDKLDVKTLNLALKLIKIKDSVAHKDTFDLFLDILGDPTT
jgi:uncharacterized protein (UPF0335 family)